MLGLVLASGLATNLAAAPFCDDLAELRSHLNTSNDVGRQDFALKEYSAEQAGCRSSLNTDGGRSLHCMWMFDYRVQSASTAFAKLLDQVESCRGAAIRKDQSVNHPDFYDLRIFDLSGSEVGVSIKDKGALQQTLVFLTVSEP